MNNYIGIDIGACNTRVASNCNYGRRNHGNVTVLDCDSFNKQIK